jgi:3-hydroxybutyryl-CoA dehydratase
VIRGYFEDHRLGSTTRTRSRTVTEADVVGFAGLSGDWHPLHTDVEYAARGPFGERIAHGMLVLSIATGLAPLDVDTVQAFYGIDKLRFINPTKLGDTIHVETEVVELVPRGESSGVVCNQVSIVNQHDQVVASAQFRMLVRRRAVEAEPRVIDAATV